MKVTNEQINTGIELAEKYGFKRIWVNLAGEFFSNENNCANSVKGKKSEYAEVNLNGFAGKKEKGTNDLEKIKEVLSHIEDAESTEAVGAILEAEKAGKNRKPVIEAAEKKLESFTQKGAE